MWFRRRTGATGLRRQSTVFGRPEAAAEPERVALPVAAEAANKAAEAGAAPGVETRAAAAPIDEAAPAKTAPGTMGPADTAEPEWAELPHALREAMQTGARAPVAARSVLREWADALVIAIVIAMFLRVFIIELYQIPSGSMTPTLIGGEVLFTDYNGDGRTDLLMLRANDSPLLFLNNGETLVGQGEVSEIDPVAMNRMRKQNKTRMVFDRILVNKLAYWTHAPRRGDIVVFKVPNRIWDPLKPIYIKRCVGEPGDVLSFDTAGYLVANGQAVHRPSFFELQRYGYVLDLDPQKLRPEVEYGASQDGAAVLERIHVPRSEIYAFGDNTWSSSDSRYWGGVPLTHVKGRAFFCYWPPDRLKLFHRN
jgi:signal peptidase I